MRRVRKLLLTAGGVATVALGTYANGAISVQHTSGQPRAAESEPPSSADAPTHGEQQSDDGPTTFSHSDWAWQIFGDDDSAELEFKVRKANILGKGKAESDDDEETAHIHGSAWGSDEATWHVSGPAGASVAFTCANPVSMKAKWVCTMGAETRINAVGLATDIKGNVHRFHLNVESVGSQTVTEKTSFKVDVSGSTGTKTTVSASAKDGAKPSVGAAAKQETQTLVSAGGSLECETTSQTSSAQGSQGETESPPVVVEETDDDIAPCDFGPYGVSSSEDVTLAARPAADGQDAFAHLDYFDVKNEMAGAYAVLVDLNGDGEPDNGPPTTGGGDGGPITPRGDGPGQWKYAMLSPPGTGGAALTTVAAVADAAETLAAFGLDGETGSAPGLIAVRLDDFAPADVRFRASSQSGAVTFPSGTDVTVRQGDEATTLRFLPAQTGDATVRLTELDANGVETSAFVDVSVDGTSTQGAAAPRIFAGVAAAGAPGCQATILPGTTVALTVGRSGFADFDTTATVVDVAVTDPDGVIVGPPTSITIPAGDVAASATLTTSSASGIARIELSSGESSCLVVLRSSAQTWSSATAVRLPQNGRTTLGYRLALPESSGRTVSVSNTAPAVLAASGTSSLVAGCLRGTVDLQGSGTGSATLTLASSGLDSLTVPVTVVSPEVSVSQTSVSLANLSSTKGGRIYLSTPLGVQFTLVQVPQNLAANILASGVGTDLLTLTLVPGAPLTGTVELAVSFEGAVTENTRIGVLDYYHPESDEPHFLYTVGVTVN